MTACCSNPTLTKKNTDMKINKVAPIIGHGGSPAVRMSAELQLRRAVLACLLWEDQFYENGEDIAERILTLCDQVSKDTLASLAVEAREVFSLRHVPLLLLCGLVKKGGSGVADTINRVITRPDQMTELMATYQHLGNTKIAKQLQKGLAMAFVKFDEYALAKYNRDGKWKLRDVLFVAHPKAPNAERDALWKRLIDGTMATPDTWEVALSAGQDKGKVFTRLLEENKLGALALIRNLRNMEQSGVNTKLIKDYILKTNFRGVLPFQIYAAANMAPAFEQQLDQKLIESARNNNYLPGKTVVMVDVSGSMRYAKISARSMIDRMTACAALASMVVGDEVEIYSFSDRNVRVPHRIGCAGVDAIIRSQMHNGTRLADAVRFANKRQPDRIIVLTDEQGTDGRVPAPEAKKAYMVNVASYQNGIANNKNGWTSLTGFSEGIFKYIRAMEE